MKVIGWLAYLAFIIGGCLGHSDYYELYELESPNLCSAAELKHGKIKLKQGNQSAAQLVNKREKHNFFCRIKVKTALKQTGIIAVIQELNLRRNDSSGQCIDYVQITSESGDVSRKYCGILNAKWQMDSMFRGPDMRTTPVEETSLINKIGQYMIVDIFVAEMNSFTDVTTINIIFTSYAKCSSEFASYGYSPCVDNSDVCIPQWYFHDNLINCPFPGCVDEYVCGIETTYTEKLSIGSKVIISSMSSLVISFIVFVLCIYLCRKYKKLCWSEDWSQPQQASEPSPRVIEMHEQPSQSQEPTADQNVEKDLPPSYESLFPDR